MLSVLEVLQRARALYSENPSHAPRGVYTDRCPAVCIDRVNGGSSTEAETALALAAGLVAAEEEELDIVARLDIIEWNARSTTEEVLAAFDRAIAAVAPRALVHG